MNEPSDNPEIFLQQKGQSDSVPQKRFRIKHPSPDRYSMRSLCVCELSTW